MPARLTDSTPPVLLDVPGLARRLTTSVRHVRRLVHERRVPYIKLGHFVRFDPAEIDAWLDQHRVRPNGSL